MTNLPTPYAAAKIAAFLAEQEHLSWTAYWDKRHGLWRVSQDDPRLRPVRHEPRRRRGHRVHGHAFLSTQLRPDAFAKTTTIPSAMSTSAPLNPGQLAPGMAPRACSRCSIYLSYLVGRTGFEPVTSSVSECRSGTLGDIIPSH